MNINWGDWKEYRRFETNIFEVLNGWDMLVPEFWNILMVYTVHYTGEIRLVSSHVFIM